MLSLCFKISVMISTMTKLTPEVILKVGAVYDFICKRALLLIVYCNMFRFFLNYIPHETGVFCRREAQSLEAKVKLFLLLP